jgi:hypothetical protein
VPGLHGPCNIRLARAGSEPAHHHHAGLQAARVVGAPGMEDGPPGREESPGGPPWQLREGGVTAHCLAVFPYQLRRPVVRGFTLGSMLCRKSYVSMISGLRFSAVMTAVLAGRGIRRKGGASHADEGKVYLP